MVLVSVYRLEWIRILVFDREFEVPYSFYVYLSRAKFVVVFGVGN